jgi:hypothetical protein
MVGIKMKISCITDFTKPGNVKRNFYVCEKCNREVFKPKENQDLCSDCEYLQLLNINTVEEYNNWLRRK